MKNIIVQATDYSPYINFDAEQKKLEIKGRAIPENAFDFFNPLISWINEFYMDDKNIKKSDVSNVLISCDYFNSASSKMLLYMFDALSKYQTAGHQISVNWYIPSDDEEMIETIDDLKLISQLKVNIITTD